MVYNKKVGQNSLSFCFFLRMPKQLTRTILLFFVSTVALAAVSIATLVLPPIRQARAAQFTVCAAGCDFTTITAALAAAGINDTILVGATYNSAGETFPISNNTVGITLDCQSSGAVIGVAGGGQKWVALGANTTIKNCSFVNARMFPNTNSLIDNNTFSTSSASSFHINSATNFVISNNTGINDLYMNWFCATGTISNNTFSIYTAGFSGGYPILFGFSTPGMTISGNTFHNYYTSYTNAITAFGTALAITNNTFDFPVTSTLGGAVHTILDISGARMTVSGNNFSYPLRDAGTAFYGVRVLPTNAATNTGATIINNTSKIPKTLSGASGPVGVWAGSDGTYATTVTTSYNIFYSTSTNATSVGISLSKNAATALTLVNDYNDFRNINQNLVLAGGATASLGANTRTSDPFFRTKDADTTNDFLLAPFSNMLNVNSTHIGSDANARRTTIYVDQAGTIDYSSVDATSTQDAIDNLLSGDTIQLAAGSYSSFTIASTTLANSSVTLAGAGASTIVSGAGATSAITFQGFDSCSVSSLLVQSAGATAAGLAFASSTNCVVTNVTSTNNGYGFWFKGSSSGNSINDSYATSSASYDVFSNVSGNNSLKNTYFSIASTTVTSSGSVSAYYKARAYVHDQAPTPVAGALVTFTDGNNSASATLTTGADGYTPYSGYLLAAVLTSGSISETAGAYNPYSITVAASSSLASASANQNINTLNQLVTLAMSVSLLTPGTPTLGTPQTTVIPLTINENGNINTTQYAIYESGRNKYVAADKSLTSEAPVWKTASDWGAPISITGLTCHTGYTFTVKARDIGLTESAFSAAATANTANCPSVGGIILPPPPVDLSTSTTPTSTVEPIISTNTVKTPPPDEKIVTPPEKEVIKTPEKEKIVEPEVDTQPVPTPTPVDVPVTPIPAPIGGNTTPMPSDIRTTTNAVTGTVRTQQVSMLEAFQISVQKNYNTIKKFVNSPQVQDTASKQVTPAIVAVTTVTVISFITWADILPLLRYLFLQPVMLLGQRRRGKWGQVYNALNKLPLDLVTVRLLDAATGRIVQTRVTDSKGRYAFIAPPGSYRISASKNSLLFPSNLLAGFTSDGRRADVYHGEVITVTQNDAVITANIPLDPSGEQKRPRRLMVERVLRTMQVGFSWAGVLVTAASTYIAPRWFMYPLLALHISLLWVFHRLAIPARVKSWGIVYDSKTKYPVGRAVVRLFSQQFNKLIDTAITDNQGRYYFMAGDNRYYVDFDHPSYEPLHKEEVDLTGKEEATITVDVGLRNKT